MRALLALLLLLLLTVAAAAPGPAPVLAANAAERWVGFTLTPGNQIQFAAMVDGAPVTAILDTGASGSFLSRAFVDATRRKVERRGQIAAIGGAVPLGWTPIATLGFGALTRHGGGLAVVALPGNVTGQAGAIDLIVGRDLIEPFALDIDYAARRFRLLPSGQLPFVGTRAPLRVGHAPLAYVTELGIAGRRLRPIVVDTGDGTALTLSRNVWRTLPLAEQPVMTTQLAFGVGGSVVADIGMLPELTIGQRVARDVPVWVERSGGFSDVARSAGRIGTGFLQRFRVLLDPRAGHMVLAPGGIDAALPHSTSGLQLAATGGELHVLHVMRGSPAEATGWRAGDRICAVDGGRTNASADPASYTRWLVGPPGTVVALTMCDGRSRTLTLRRFY